MRFSLVYLSKLLYRIHFNSNTILQNIFQVRLLLAKIRRMRPGYLDSCACLGYVSERTLVKWI